MKYLAVLIVLLTTLMQAQTISPLNAECGKKCNGEFSVTNNNVIPMVVTVESYSFIFKDGKPVVQKENADIRLNARSARLSPKETYVFDYRIKCIQYPCSVGFAAGMMVGHTDTGVNLRLILNHVVYSCEKAKNCRINILRASGVQIAGK